MPTKGRTFAGCTVALVTPFRDGEVDEPALRQSVKTALALVGRGNGEPRLPLTPPVPQVCRRLTASLTRHGLRVVDP